MRKELTGSRSYVKQVTTPDESANSGQSPLPEHISAFVLIEPRIVMSPQGLVVDDIISGRSWVVEHVAALDTSTDPGFWKNHFQPVAAAEVTGCKLLEKHGSTDYGYGC